MDAAVVYVVGEDDTTRANDASTVINEIVGNEDRSLCVESYDLTDAEDEEGYTAIVEASVNSLMSPPFLTSKRVVVLRNIGAAPTESLASLISYMDDPMPTSHLVVVQGKGRISTSLTKAWKKHVQQVGTAKETVPDMFTRLTREHKLTFEPGVREIIFKHCGSDTSVLSQMISRLINVYGAESTLSVSDVQGYLGESGTVPIYELANDITSGNANKALDVVTRMLHSTGQNAKPMHPLQIVSLLANHFRKLATVDDPSIRNKQQAHDALGAKGNPYASQKTWESSRRLGSHTLLCCIDILSMVDISLKGANALDVTIAIELAIISLCRVCNASSDEEREKIRNEYSTSLYV